MALKIHHINTATLCPRGGPLLHNRGWLDWDTKMVAHALVIETNDGLVVIDTGFGMDDVRNPERHGLPFRLIVNPQFSEEETVLYQIQKLGFKAADVRHIIPTHLDIDHAGGLPDFPQATVHIFEPEYQAAMARDTFAEQARYVPEHWAHGPIWRRYNVQGEIWNGFQCVRDLEGLPPEILMIPTIGHTRGHCCIAIDTKEQGWLMHAGDAYFHHSEVGRNPDAPLGFEVFQTAVAVDNSERKANQKKLRDLVVHQGSDLTIFCAHDEYEFDCLRNGQKPR